jgi:signal peptidase I
MVVCVFLGAIIILAVGSGRLRVFTIPTEGMKPTVSRHDQVVMEGFTYFFRSPRQGEIVAFRTDGLPGVNQGLSYLARVAGKPGEGHYFLLGDNSAHSFDCRFFGPVPAKNIRGKILGRR